MRRVQMKDSCLFVLNKFGPIRHEHVFKDPFPSIIQVSIVSHEGVCSLKIFLKYTMGPLPPQNGTELRVSMFIVLAWHVYSSRLDGAARW